MKGGARWRRVLLCACIGAVFGLGISIVAAMIGGLAGTVLLVVALIAVGPAVLLLMLRYSVPRRCHKLMTGLVDKQAGPPRGTPVAELGAAGRWATTLTASDWDAAADLLADDFFYKSPISGKTIEKKAYTRSMRLTKFVYDTWSIELDEVRCDPAEPAVFWVRFTQTSHPHSGPDLDTTWWERWTLDEARERLRDATLVGVTRVN